MLYLDMIFLKMIVLNEEMCYDYNGGVICLVI